MSVLCELYFNEAIHEKVKTNLSQKQSGHNRDPFFYFVQNCGKTNARFSFFFNAMIGTLKMHKETDRALHESGNYISAMFSIDTTNKESGTKLNNYYINILLQ